jgi:hypothetical protein
MIQRPSMSDRFVLACWLFVCAVAFFVGIGLIALGRFMAPIRPGSPALFWLFACGVDLDATGRGNYIPGGDAYVIDENWVAYDDRNLHGSELYFVAMPDVMARFDRVVAELEEKRQHGDESAFVQGYAEWRVQNPDSRDITKLVEITKNKFNERSAARGIRSLAYAVAQEQQFWQRWQRAKWYWANFVFEWVFLTGLALWTVWPGIRRRGPWIWAAHASTLPFLFWLPVFLGYASWSFTSAGPSGGIVYPFLLIFTRGGYCDSLDQWLLAHTPQILEPLSTPNGDFVSISGGMPGPTSAFIAGLILAANAFFVAFVAQHLHRRFRSTSAQNRPALVDESLC